MKTKQQLEKEKREQLEKEEQEPQPAAFAVGVEAQPTKAEVKSPACDFTEPEDSQSPAAFAAEAGSATPDLPSGAASSAGPSPPTAALAAGQREGETAAEEKGAPHPKWPISCINLGKSAKQPTYLAHMLYSMPAFVVVGMEVTEKQLEILAKANDQRSEDKEWQEREGTATWAKKKAAFAARLAGVENWEDYKLPPPAEHAWRYCVCEKELCCFGRDTRVKHIRVVDSWNDSYDCRKGETSRLALWEVEFLVAMCGQTKWRVVGGHCNAHLAKKKDARRRFFDALRQLCVRGVPGLDKYGRKAWEEGLKEGARILALDMNMSMFAVVREMQDRGLECLLASFHCEFNRKTKELNYDSMGIWLVGPLQADKCKWATMKHHCLAGGLHPYSEQHMDNLKDCHRGWPASSYIDDVPEFPAFAGTLEAVEKYWKHSRLIDINQIGGVAAAWGLKDLNIWCPQVQDPVTGCPFKPN